jgi:protocatechuate 3,4-dioxygenase beta subunit
MRSAEPSPAGPITRRHALGLLGAFAVAGLAACADGGPDASNASGSSATTTTTPDTTAPDATARVTQIPEETPGPYPGDGSNGPDVLIQDGVVRADIRPSFGSSAGTAGGVPVTIALTVVDPGNGGAPVADAGVYVWHCDREGRYSLYSQGATDQNYLRGVQPTDSNGLARFISIFPACYPGRWPHVHFEVFRSIDVAVAAGAPLATSQIALPADTCDAVFATSGYAQSASNLSRVSLASDSVFGDDGGIHELATVTGNAHDGYTLALTVGVDGASRV